MRGPGLLALAMLGACGAGERPGIPPRHVLLVTIEGLRADHVSALGHHLPTTALPSDELARAQGRAMGIDDLAASGVQFAQAFAPSGSTLASLAALLTGRSPFESGVVDDGCRLPNAVPGLATRLAREGFETAAFATAPALDLREALGRGFERFEERDDDPRTVAAALEWIARDSGNERPFLLWIHLAGPAAAGPTAAEYDASLMRATRELARFLEAAFDFHRDGLEGSETWARTVLVLASPRGRAHADLGRSGPAAAVHDAVLRVPLVLRHPDSLTGERILSEVVQLEDVVPTLLDWFGIASPGDLTGRSLLPLVDSYRPRPFERRAAITLDARKVMTARTGAWRLVWDPAAAPPRVELFDCRRDPHGLEDVAASHPAVVEELLSRTREWRVGMVASQRIPLRIGAAPAPPRPPVEPGGGR